jgi:hypothetical protein
MFARSSRSATCIGTSTWQVSVVLCVCLMMRHRFYFCHVTANVSAQEFESGFAVDGFEDKVREVKNEVSRCFADLVLIERRWRARTTVLYTALC